MFIHFSQMQLQCLENVNSIHEYSLFIEGLIYLIGQKHSNKVDTLVFSKTFKEYNEAVIKTFCTFDYFSHTDKVIVSHLIFPNYHIHFNYPGHVKALTERKEL